MSLSWLALLYGVLAVLTLVAPAHAQSLDAIVVPDDSARIDITPSALSIDDQGDSLRVNTAPDADGVRRLMSVRAQERDSNPNWFVFALRNETEKPITRWLTAEKYDVIGSGVIWPDLDSARIRAITPSVGFVPQKVDNERADVFRITLQPGQTITYVAELASKRASNINLWQPLAYELKVRDRQLFNGIMLGITGLLGVFLTAVFAANHKVIFPSAALVAWCVLAYLCVDFGFWHKLLQLRAEDNAVYRAATEAAMAASLAIFLYAFLRLGAWHGFIRMLALVWITAALSLVFVAVLDPRLASTFARLSFAGVGGIGALLTVFLAIRGQDRALSLIPTWILFLVWLFGATTTLTGQLNGDLVVSSLVAGLTLIVVLLGFTVTQFAFGAMEPAYRAAPSEQNLRSLAVDGSGAAVWDWHARRDEIKVSPIVENALGLKMGEMSSKLEHFLSFFHPADKERFRVLLASIRERGSGIIQTDFRLRHTDNSYRWFDLEAASVPTADRRTLRCVGLLRDVTDMRRAQSRLMHDAVHDSITNLPNRQLFLDRLSVALTRAQSDRTVVPKIVYIDIGKFKSVNSSYGLIVGDSLLLTLANRLTHHLGPQDTLARVAGDQFAILLLTEVNPNQLAQLAEQLRRAIRAPIRIAGQDVVLTSAIGIAVHDGNATPDKEDNDLLREAEIAMHRAKRQGPDNIEIFRKSMRNSQDDRVANESELAQALERKQVKLFFRPIVYLPREELAGFETLVRWEHPRLGTIDPFDLLPSSANNDLLIKLSNHILLAAVEQAAEWQRLLPRAEHPIFVSVDISGPQLLQNDFVQEIRHIVGRAIVPDGVLRLAVKEAVAMQNPERAAEFLESLKSAGAKLALDEFGTGYTSLAYLRRFPFDTIGIDHGLVRSASDDQSGVALVRSIVALAHELGKLVTAEGVETAEDASFLRSIGCEYAQGFYYGEPMTDRETAELLKVVRKSERKVQQQSFFRTKSQIERDRLPAAKKSDLIDRKQRNELPSGADSLTASASKTTSERKSATGRARPSLKSQSPAARSSRPTDSASTKDATRKASSGQARKRTIKGPQQQPSDATSTVPVRPPVGMTPPPPRSTPARQIERSNGNGVPPTPERLPVRGTAAPTAAPSTRSLPPAPMQGEEQSTSPPLKRADNHSVAAPPPLPHEAGAPPSTRRVGPNDALPDLSSLPPGIAASLARLAGVDDKGPATGTTSASPQPKKKSDNKKI